MPVKLEDLHDDIPYYILFIDAVHVDIDTETKHLVLGKDIRKRQVHNVNLFFSTKLEYLNALKSRVRKILKEIESEIEEITQYKINNH